LGADALIAALHPCFEAVKDPGKGQPQISLHDVLMSAFAMFSLKDPSLLQFDRRRIAEEHRLKELLPQSNGQVKASSFTGKLRIPQGEVRETVFDFPVYEKYLVLSVEAGKVVHTEVVHPEKRLAGWQLP
jgi:hypothetical protein